MKVRYSDVLAWVRGKTKMSQVLGALGCWVSPCSSLFSLGTRFETFISLIFQFFFSGRGKTRITEIGVTEAVDTEERCSEQE
jgi:hypothetical protein